MFIASIVYHIIHYMTHSLHYFIRPLIKTSHGITINTRWHHIEISCPLQTDNSFFKDKKKKHIALPWFELGSWKVLLIWFVSALSPSISQPFTPGYSTVKSSSLWQTTARFITAKCEMMFFQTKSAVCEFTWSLALTQSLETQSRICTATNVTMSHFPAVILVPEIRVLLTLRLSWIFSLQFNGSDDQTFQWCLNYYVGLGAKRYR